MFLCWILGWRLFRETDWTEESVTLCGMKYKPMVQSNSNPIPVTSSGSISTWIQVEFIFTARPDLHGIEIYTLNRFINATCWVLVTCLMTCNKISCKLISLTFYAHVYIFSYSHAEFRVNSTELINVLTYMNCNSLKSLRSFHVAFISLFSIDTLYQTKSTRGLWLIWKYISYKHFI